MNPVYLVMIGVCIISSLTMFLHMRDNSVLSSKSKKYFTLLFFSIIVVAAAEALGDWMNIDGSYRTAHFIVKCIEFSLMPFLPVFMSLACNIEVLSKWIVIPFFIHAAFEWLVLPFHLIINIDSMGFYHRGPLYAVFLIIDVTSLIYLLIAFFSLSGKYGAKKTATVWMIAVVLFSALIPPIINGKCHTSILGITFSAIILYEYYQSMIQSEMSENLEKQQESLKRLFEQTATALVNVIDAKDKYTHGHSARVAEYSRKIAEMIGKSEEECEEIYFSALLHDVGKIGIPLNIINKKGKLTDEEYEIMKKHPVIGEEILSSISEYPYLSVAAHYHHERYDGKGYPRGLKGEDIPEIARIVAVADAYDAMTSKRSYREAIPQAKVREEIVKGAGTQFDPVFAHAMQHIIDLDTEYALREKGEVKEIWFDGRTLGPGVRDMQISIESREEKINHKN